MEERKGTEKHMVTLTERERISVTGVLEVLSFDEESVVADTERGILIIRGLGLHVNKLNLDDGLLGVDGEIDALEYSESYGLTKGKGSLFGKIFK